MPRPGIAQLHCVKGLHAHNLNSIMSSLLSTVLWSQADFLPFRSAAFTEGIHSYSSLVAVIASLLLQVRAVSTELTINQIYD